MNRRLANWVALVPILVSTSLAWADGVLVTLSPRQQIVRSGETPRFVVKAKAVGASLRIMKFAVRDDLRDNYARIRVTRNGMDVDVPIVISDPGPTAGADYALLAPGRQMVFEHQGTPFVLSKLPPGDYSAKVSLQPDWRDVPVASNSVSFRVVPK